MIRIAHSERVTVAIVTQHAKHNAPYCHIWPDRLYNTFPHCLIKCTIFEEKKGGKKTGHWIKYVCFISPRNFLTETYLILRRTQRVIIINIHTVLCKVTVILVRFYWKLNFLDFPFSKNLQICNFMKIRPVGTELFLADRQTDMTKLTVACKKFCEPPPPPKRFLS